MVLRLLCGAMFCLFALAVIVQHNDPDPALWMALYALPAAFSLLGIAKRFYRGALVPATIYFALCLLWGPNWRNVNRSIWQPHLEMMGDDIERAREVIGLFIAAAWMAFLAGIAHHRRNSQTHTVHDEPFNP